jgi:hypothetical protein
MGSEIGTKNSGSLSNFESGEVKQLYVKINPRNNIPKIILCTNILSLVVTNYLIF